AVSKAKQAHIDSELVKKYINIAANRYNEERESQRKPRGVRKICREVEQECFLETRKKITLPKSTVSARANGRTSIQDFNATKRWLTPAEEDVVVEFAIDAGLRGFPLTHRMLKDHVDAI
ncbi:hypothetical protein BD309DRAFT_835379, partial [Dichomitus squalens]